VATTVDVELFTRLITARTKDAVAAVINEIQSSVSCTWMPVGGNDMNISAIHVGGSPAHQLVERPINAFDGYLELMKMRHPEDDPHTPFEAARLWAGIPAEGLRRMDDNAKRELAKSVARVIMADSGDDRRPTVITRDFGIGVHPDDFAGTILSIHGRNKRTKRYLHGTYGHGAATALRYSPYTVIAARYAPEFLDGQIDEIGITVIRFRGPEGEEKEGVYVYLATEDGQVLRVSAADAPKEFRDSHGVYVAHVAYDIPTFSADYKRQKTGLWGLLNGTLFDPVLPVLMLGERDKDLAADPKSATTGRFAAGNTTLLGGKNRRAPVALEDSVTLRLGSDSSVALEWWVLDRDRVTNAETYVPADQQLTVTINGQRHAARGRQWFKQLKYSYLSKLIVVHVKADGLTYEQRSNSFSSVRVDDVRGGFLDEVVLRQVAEALMDDQRLGEHEEMLHQADLARSAERASDALRRKVAQRMDRILRGRGLPGLNTGDDDSKKGKSNGQPSAEAGWKAPGEKPKKSSNRIVKRPKPMPIPDDSYLRVVPETMTLEPGPKRIRQGRGGQIILLLDAKNDYLPTNESDLSVEITDPHRRPATELTYRGCTRLLGGKSRLQFTSEIAAEVGTYDVKITLITPNGTLFDQTKIELRPAPRRRRPAAVGGGGLPDIKWIREEDEWPDDWDDDEVGDVQISGDSITIRVSALYEPLKEALSRRSGNAITSFKNRYLVAVAVALWMQEIFEGQNADQDPAGMKAARHWMGASAIEAIDIEGVEEDVEE
jgi:hypothetical protein